MKIGMIIFFMVGLFCMSAKLHSESARELNLVEMAIPRGDTVMMILPNDWMHQLIRDEPSSIRIYPDDSRSVILQISFSFDRDFVFGTQERVEMNVERASQRYIEGSVERRCFLRKFKSKDVIGSYAVFTDADLAKKRNIGPPDYKHMTTGMIVLGRNITTFRLLSNSLESDSYKQMLSVLADGLALK